MTDFFDAIRGLIAEDDISAAIDQLRQFLSGQSRTPGPMVHRFKDLSTDVTVESGAWNGLLRDKRNGTRDPADIDRRERRTKVALLDINNAAEAALERSKGPVVPQTPAVKFDAPEASQLEKVWGRNTLQNVAWLQKGIAASRAVCRVVTPKSLGTGFMVAGGRVVTNNHVLADPELAAQTFVEFNFEEDARGRMQQVYSYPAIAEGFVTLARLDCSVLRLAEVPGAPPLSSWGAVSLNGDDGLEVGQHLSIIQHPSGGQKKIAVTANEIVNIFDHRIQYMTDTMPGSSGAPVFDDAWTVVALHHAGGNLVKNTKGERIFANEGIKMRDILGDPTLAQALTG